MPVHGKIHLPHPFSWCTNHLTIALIAVSDLVPQAQTVALERLTPLISAAGAAEA